MCNHRQRGKPCTVLLELEPGGVDLSGEVQLLSCQVPDWAKIVGAGHADFGFSEKDAQECR
ncbi:MAG: hypothetical protein D0530_00600 [Methylococcales bacterium]|nr:MAG: hypothetical protein D0530_00600 [Methylococcales bacterium]